MLKLAVVIFALVAVAHAGYVVIDTYPDMYCNTTVVARFISTVPAACQQIPAKRAAQQTGACSATGAVNYIVDYTNCAATGEPELPAGWQGVQITPESSCNVTADANINSTSYLGAPAPFTNTLIQTFTPQFGMIAANTSLSCGANGVQSVTTCVDTGALAGVVCSALSLSTGVCTPDNYQQNYGLQQTCIAPPTAAAPVAAPTASAPTSSAPVASPVKTPVKAPAKASSASALCGSVAILSLAALF